MKEGIIKKEKVKCNSEARQISRRERRHTLLMDKEFQEKYIELKMISVHIKTRDIIALVLKLQVNLFASHIITTKGEFNMSLNRCIEILGVEYGICPKHYICKRDKNSGRYIPSTLDHVVILDKIPEIHCYDDCNLCKENKMLVVNGMKFKRIGQGHSEGIDIHGYYACCEHGVLLLDREGDFRALVENNTYTIVLSLDPKGDYRENMRFLGLSPYGEEKSGGTIANDRHDASFARQVIEQANHKE